MGPDSHSSAFVNPTNHMELLSEIQIAWKRINSEKLVDLSQSVPRLSEAMNNAKGDANITVA